MIGVNGIPKPDLLGECSRSTPLLPLNASRDVRVTWIGPGKSFRPMTIAPASSKYRFPLVTQRIDWLFAIAAVAIQTRPS